MSGLKVIIESKNSLWKGKALYDLYEEAYTPWEWHSKLIERAKNLDLVIFSTPFDESAVDFLEELSLPAYKIASFEITDSNLIKSQKLVNQLLCQPEWLR